MATPFRIWVFYTLQLCTLSGLFNFFPTRSRIICFSVYHFEINKKNMFFILRRQFKLQHEIHFPKLAILIWYLILLMNLSYLDDFSHKSFIVMMTWQTWWKLWTWFLYSYLVCFYRCHHAFGCINIQESSTEEVSGKVVTLKAYDWMHQICLILIYDCIFFSHSTRYLIFHQYFFYIYYRVVSEHFQLLL